MLSSTAEQTRDNIKDAFWRLYTQKPIRKVSVTEVCTVAGYNRSTFYTYFHDVYDVLDAIETELIPVDEFTAVIMRGVSNPEGSQAILSEFLSLFETCDAYFSVLLSRDGDPNFRSKLLSRFLAAFSQALPSGLSKESRYVLEYQNAGIMMTIARWYMNGKDIPAEELIHLLLNLTQNGTQSVFQKACRGRGDCKTSPI